MTDLLSDVETPSDAELISRVRGGDVAAYGDLFSRHKDAANRLSRQLVRGPDADDLVSEAFAKVLSVLQGGGGPDVAFRAYLLTAVRRLHVDRIRSGQRLQTTDDMTPFDPGVPFQDTAVAGFESGAAAKAFASLPERWQLVLWHLEVEGQKPADIAPLLGMSANSVSALAYRAREGLRQAFLTMHISDLSETDCRWVNEHLGAFIRKGLSKRDAGKVQAHLDECRRCTAMYLELTEVNSNLAGIIAPLLLGAAATGYLASTGAAAGGVLGLVSKVKEFVGANTGAVTATGVAVGIAAAAAVAIATLGGGGGHGPAAAGPSPALSTPAAPAPSLPATRTKPSSTPTSKTAAKPTTSGSASAAAVLAPVAPATSSTGATPGAGPTGGPGSTPVSQVDVGGTTIDDQGVHLLAVGSPALPPTMTVRLLSQPAGVLFASSPDCSVTPDGLSALCNTVSGSGGTVPGAARLAAPTSYAAFLPFDQNAGPDAADLSVVVDVPNGFEVTGGAGSIASHHYLRPARAVDVALSLDQAAVRPENGNDYSLTGHLGVSGPGATALQTVTYTAAGGTFASSGTSTMSRSTTDATPTFVVVPDTAAAPRVTITAGVPATFLDTDGSNDSAQPVLEPYDVGLSALSPGPGKTADDSGNQQFTATLDADAFPGTLILSVTGPADSTHSTPTVTGDQVTFTVHSVTAGAVGLRADLPASFTDPDQNDNAVSGMFTLPDADLALTLPQTVTADPDGSYSLNGALAGVPPGYTGTTRFTVSSGAASFVAGDGCVLDGAALVCDGTDGSVPLHLTAADNSVDTPVQITVSPLVGFTDDEQANNHPGTTLTAFVPPVPDADLALTLDSPAAADADGGYTVTGHLGGVPAGYTGPVTYSLSGDPATFGTTTGCTAVVATLVCDAPSAGAVALQVDAADNAAPTDVTVTVAPLVGYTDQTAANNAAQVTLKAVPAPTYDVALTGLSPVTATADAQGAQQFTADLDRAGFPGTVSFELADGPAGAVLTAPTDPATGTVTFTVTSSSLAGHAVGIRVVLSDPASDPAPGNNTPTSTWSPREYDVSLTGLQAAPGTADASGDQSFTATLGRDGFTGTVGYSLTGPSDLSVTGSSVSGSTVTFTVHSTKTDLGTAAVTLRADLPGGYTDPAPGNNADGATYTYFAPFAYDGAATAHATTVNDYDVTAAVKNIPAGATTLVLSVPELQERTNSATGPCVVTDTHTVTCALPTGATSFTAHFNAQLPGTMSHDRNTLTATAGSSSVTTQITFP